MNQKEFLDRVLCPGHHYMAYVGRYDDKGDPIFYHESFTDTAQGVHEAARIAERGKDVYFAVAAYREAKVHSAKYNRMVANRKQENVTSLNTLYLDLDFKKYPSPQAAIAALRDFLTTTGLQRPTILVNTGGGLHIYWTFPKPLPVGEWLRLAVGLRDLAVKYGLHTDHQVTIDSARILRMPETYNYKPEYGTPKLAEVVANRDEDVDMAALKATLATVVPMRAAQLRKVGMAVDASVAGMFGGSSVADLTQGVEEPKFYARNIVAECPLMRDMLARGGDGDSRELWNNTLLLLSYTEDGEEYAHKLSQGDSRYTREETDREFGMKLDIARGGGNAKPTRCDTFSVSSSICQTCPHWGQINSPYKLGRERRKEVAVPNGLPSSSRNGSTYALNKDNVEVELFDGELDRPMLLRDALENLIIRLTIRSARVTVIDMMTELVGTRDYVQKRFREHGYGEVDIKLAERVVLAWMEILRREDQTGKVKKPFGWSDDGFSIGGTLYRPDGTSSVVAVTDMAPYYKAAGTQAAWDEIAKVLIGDARPEIQLVIATAFAAPLVAFTTMKATVVSIRSPSSGVGKSTAVQVAQAVWGKPDSTSQGHDTALATQAILASLSHMPWYWDELKTNDPRQISDLVFQVIQGATRARATRDGGVRARHEIRGMLVVASNRSMKDLMWKENYGTDAGMMRVLEVTVSPPASAMADFEFETLLRKLSTNHGHIGVAYAKFLAAHQSQLEKAVSDVNDYLVKEFQPTKVERFWTATAATLVVGAGLANTAGLAKFDIPRMIATLKAILLENRKLSIATTDPNELVKELYRFYHDRRWITDHFDLRPGKMGRPIKVKVYGEQPRSVRGPGCVRLAVLDGILAIYQNCIEEFAQLKGREASRLHTALLSISRNQSTVLSNMDKGIDSAEGSRSERDYMYVFDAEPILGSDALDVWLTSAGGHSAASPDSSSGTAPSGSTPP